MRGRKINCQTRDALRAFATAELPRTHLHRLQRRGVIQQSGETIEQLAIRNQSADVVMLQKGDVEAFLTAERSRREQRPAARERFRDADSARLAYDHV